MKSKKITSIKQARKVIVQSGILEVHENDGTVCSNLVTWENSSERVNIGKLLRDRKSRRVYIVVGTSPSELRVLAKVFNYEIVCNLYGGFEYRDVSILWLKEAVNERTT